MQQKIISFFLASSIKELEYDRLSIGDFINQLNSIYMQQNLYIRLYKCESEYMNHSIAVDGSQRELDDLIKESDLCFVIFWKKAGEFTIHEFEVALEAFKANNRPKVVVYFKTLPDGESISDDIRDIMSSIDNGLLHYHREYSHIDSLKLGIITQLQVHGFVSNPLKVDNENVMVGGSPVLPTDNIPLFSANEEYTSLLEDYNNLKNECSLLQEKFRANPSDIHVYRKLKKAIKDCERAKEDIDELSDNILKIGNKIATLTMGPALTDKIRNAIACFDRGDYLGVLDILNPQDIEDNLQKLDELEDEITQKRISIVEEYRLRIAALKVLGKIREVHETYEKAVAQVCDRNGMPKAIMLEYAQFLYEQKMPEKALSICNRLAENYENGISSGNEREKADIYNLMGVLYFEVNDCELSESHHKSALEIRENLAADDDFYRADVAESCNNLASVYYSVNRHKETEDLYIKAVTIYEELSLNFNVYEVKLAETLMNLAKLYYQVNYHEQAEKVYNIALIKFKELTLSEPEKYNVFVARACNKLAFLCNALNYHEAVDLLYVDSLKLKRELGKTTSFEFYRRLNKYCVVLSDMFARFGYAEYSDSFKQDADFIECQIDNNRFEPVAADESSFNGNISYYQEPHSFEKTEQLCHEAIEIYKKLAGANPEAFDDEMANTESNLAFLYFMQGKYMESEKIYNNVIQKYKLLVQVSPEVMNRELSYVYRNTAELLTKMKRYDESEKLYCEALKIYDSMSKSSGKFDNDLAKTYKGLAKLYAAMGKQDEAVLNFYLAAKTYIKLYLNSPKAYIDRVINIIADISVYMFPGDNYNDLM